WFASPPERATNRKHLLLTKGPHLPGCGPFAVPPCRRAAVCRRPPAATPLPAPPRGDTPARVPARVYARGRERPRAPGAAAAPAALRRPTGACAPRPPAP